MPAASTPAAPSIADLEHAGSDLTAVTRLVAALEKSDAGARTITFGIAGNITVDLLGTYLRKQALLHGARARILVGGFDDPLGSAATFAAEGADVAILLNLADAILPAFEARVPTMSAETIAKLVERTRNQLALTLASLRETRHVLVALLHRLTPPAADQAEDPVDTVISALNAAILTETSRHANVTVLATDAIAGRLGWSNAHDWRSYERFRAPFTPAFMDQLALTAFRATRGFGSYFYKALVLDCDNTLWGGIIGEDLASGISLGPHGAPGSIFWRVQQEYLALQRSGVLLCLCSKNNPEDVASVLATHPEMVLRETDIAAQAVNWGDKATNLINLATELNIGLDAMVYVDDSSFECEAIRTQLPMVRVIQVPATLADYPAVTRELRELFLPAGATLGGVEKTAHYRIRSQALAEQGRHGTQEEFLQSLGLKVSVRRNETGAVGRIAELTQKSNQFNLTTHRFTVAEVTAAMESRDTDVFSIHVADRFGDSGLTGVVVVRYEEDATAVIDTFLMSCRVLGRGVETSLWAPVLDTIRARGATTLRTAYLPTAKNDQVREFWERLGMASPAVDADGRRTYRADLGPLQLQAAAHIEVDHAV
jgi:FkbH-like protein